MARLAILRERLAQASATEATDHDPARDNAAFRKAATACWHRPSFAPEVFQRTIAPVRTVNNRQLLCSR
jgi:hypothetical protein